MQLTFRIFLFNCFNFCALISKAQGDEFLQIIHKPKDNAQVKAVFEKANLKFKYGDTGYTHGDTYVSDAGNSRYYMYAIVDSTVRSVTFYHTDGGEAKPCPFELPLGVTNTMKREQMRNIFGTTTDTIIKYPNTTYTSYEYNYYKGTTKITFVYTAADILVSTTLAYVYPYADNFYEEQLKHYAEVVRKNTRGKHSDYELLFAKQTHENVNEPLEMEAGYSYQLWIIYDSATVSNLTGTLQFGGKTYPVKIFSRNSYYYNGV